MGNDRTFKISLISNKEPTQEEFDKLLQMREKGNEKRLTVDWVRHKYKDIKAAQHYNYNDEEIEQLLA